MGDSARLRRAWIVAIAVAVALTAARMAIAGTYTLDQAIRTALANNPALAVADASVDEADARVREARAGYMPQLSIEGGYQYISEINEIEFSMDTPIGPIARSIEMGAHDNWQAAAKLSQPLFQGGAAFYSHRAAKKLDQAARLERPRTEAELVRNVTRAYYGVLLADQTLTVLDLSLQNAQMHRNDVKNRVDAGYASRAELIRAEVEVNAIVPEIGRAEQAKTSASIALRTLMGLPPDETVRAAGTLTPAPAPPPRNDLLESAAERPELEMLDAQQTAAETSVKAYRAGWIPKAAATASYQYQKPYFVELDGQDYFTVGVGVSIPVFEGLRTPARMDQARAQARKAEAARAAQTDRIRGEVDDALARLAEAEQRIASTRKNAELAADALRMTNDAYREGAGTNLDVMDANLKLMQARLAHLQAVHDHRVAGVDLEYAAGLNTKGESR